MGELVLGDKFDYVLLLVLAVLPFLYKTLFWLYVIQLKEYRWDRFREYLTTRQGKSALFSVFWALELVLLVLAIGIWLPYLFKNPYYIAVWGVFYNMFFYFLVFENIFVIGKIFRKRILKPKLTKRLFILASCLAVGLFLDLFFIDFFNLYSFIFIYILSVFLAMPFVIFFCNFFTLPLVNFLKNRQINKAIEKSKKINNPPIKIAITGSYGKSSVKEFLASILEQIPLSQGFPQGEKEVKNVLKTPENINTELGVSALVLNKLSDKFKYFVAEIGAYRVGEIKTLGKIVNHKYGFLTAIGNQHIGLFGSQENIIKGKFEILEKVIENNGKLYVNGDNKYIEEYYSYLSSSSPHPSPLPRGEGIKDFIIKYGIKGKDLDARSKIIEIKQNRFTSLPLGETEGGLNFTTKFEFSYSPHPTPVCSSSSPHPNPLPKGEGIKGKIKETFETNLIGEHNILNLTGILAFCYDIGLKTEDLKKYLLHIKKPKNTGEIIPLSKSFPQGEKDLKVEIIAIDDTYNLSEAGLKSGISLLKYFKDKQKILVLDDILELGKDAEKVHYDLAKEIAENKQVDKVLFVGVNYRESFEKGLIDGGFSKKNILSNLSSFSIKGSSSEEGRGDGLSNIILFEGRNAKKYLDKLKNNGA